MSPFELALLGYLRSFHAALVAVLDDETIRERSAPYITKPPALSADKTGRRLS